jgi:hypothetical protein
VLLFPPKLSSHAIGLYVGAGVAGEGGGVDGELFRCRKCRRILGTHANVLHHTAGQRRNDFRFCRAARSGAPLVTCEMR